MTPAYQNTTCPYCGAYLTQNDDIVVCPVCGTPHHRSCYMEHGCCANEAKHPEGFIWSAPAPEKTETSESQQQSQSHSAAERVCPVCGTVSSADQRFCGSCGARLDSVDSNSSYRQAYTNAYRNQLPFRDTDEFEDIPVSEWREYIGHRFFEYILRFKRQDLTNRKISPKWVVMLFPSLWFFTHRMWAWGIISQILQILLNLPALYFLNVLVPGGNAVLFSPVVWQKIAQACVILGIGLNIFWMMYAIWLYRKSAAKKIKHLKEISESPEDYEYRLHKMSGITFIPFIVYAALYFVSYFI